MFSVLRKRTPLVAFLLLAVLTTTVYANGSPGTLTTTPAMLDPVAPGSSVLPIITVGDTIVDEDGSTYTYESIPDGLAISQHGSGAVDVFVAHETSLVPFPYTPGVSGQSDFYNAQVSRLRLNPQTAGVLSGKIMIPSRANYQRFCSSFLADEAVGFQKPVLFLNEEATDFVSKPPLLAWPPDPAKQRQAGYVVALEIKSGKYYPIPGMGRLNHENTVVVPGGWSEVVALTGDDTFSAPSSQLYLYKAASPAAMLADQGGLYAFVADNPAINDYGDLTTGMSVGGTFIPVPRSVAVADQTALESWSNANNVFQFIRIEDLAYDKNSPRVVYFADTGEPRAIYAAPGAARLSRGPSSTRGPFPNGRIFKMVFNADNPLLVDSLSVLIDADAGGYNNPDALHNPDNLDTSANSLMIQEDPGSHNGYAPGAGPSARVWRYDLTTGELTVVAEVNQSLDPAAREGTWESSGIVDASAVFGPGTWLVNVQAHSIFTRTETRTVNNTPLLFKNEGGQLLLLTVPGS